MKLIGATVCLTIICSGGLGAQTDQTRTKTKITVRDGQSVTVTGCVMPAASGNGFTLTNVADKNGAVHSYTLVSDDTDLSKHVGHRVQISGKVTDRGDAKVKTETKTKTKVENGDDRETHSKAEIQGDLSMPYLGVHSVKMIAQSCP